MGQLITDVLPEVKKIIFSRLSEINQENYQMKLLHAKELTRYLSSEFFATFQIILVVLNAWAGCYTQANREN